MSRFKVRVYRITGWNAYSCSHEYLQRWKVCCMSLFLCTLLLFFSAVRKMTAPVTDKRQTDDNVHTLEKKLEKECQLRESLATMLSKAHDEITLLRGKLAIAESKEIQKNIKGSESSDNPAAQEIDARTITSISDNEKLLREEVTRLSAHVRRQKRLIDILQRQKILLEAASVVDLTLKDFDSGLEIQKL